MSVFGKLRNGANLAPLLALDGHYGMRDSCDMVASHAPHHVQSANLLISKTAPVAQQDRASAS